MHVENEIVLFIIDIIIVATLCFSVFAERTNGDPGRIEVASADEFQPH